MFAEEEWTDSLPAADQSHAGVRTETRDGKHFSIGCHQQSKAISKRCLKRTLQTLGTVPEWESTKPSDGSDEEMEEASVHINKKKKKCKKRKKIADTRDEGEQHEDVDMPETTVKKRRTKQKLKEPSKKSGTCESGRDNKGLQKSSNNTDDTSDKTLSRNQWRNKMKNKKRCKNKFKNTSGDATVNLKEEKLEQKQADSEEKTLIHDMSTSSNTPEKNKARKIKRGKNKGKESKDLNHLKCVAEESVCKQPKAASNELQKPADSHEKLKPVKIDKHFQIRTKKLHHILKGHVTDSNKKSIEEKQEAVITSEKKGENTIDRSSALRLRMEKRLESARFRYINELLYTTTSGEAKRMFKQDPDAIGIYHQGYTEQVKHWPANPVDSIIAYIRQKPASLVVADFGCGDCKIARSVKNQVHCFDLAPVCDLVTACDMANVPLADHSVDIVVFCLSLMGTNLSDFLAEANRVLVDGGVLRIAEVASRFEDLRQFTGALARLGFKLVTMDTKNTHFYSFELTKTRNAPDNVKKIGLQLKPCLYKKR